MIYAALVCLPFDASIHVMILVYRPAGFLLLR